MTTSIPASTAPAAGTPSPSTARVGGATVRLSSVNTIATLAKEGAASKDWYHAGRMQIRDLCLTEDWDYPRFVDILALTSPRVSVTRNFRMAVHYMRTGETTHDTTRSTRAALAHYEATGEIRGRKVSAFSRALRGDESAVVIDVWMSRAFKVDENRLSGSPVLYRKCSERVRLAARRVGMTPAETQAAVWHATLKRHGMNVPAFKLEKL